MGMIKIIIIIKYIKCVRKNQNNTGIYILWKHYSVSPLFHFDAVPFRCQINHILPHNSKIIFVLKYGCEFVICKAINRDSEIFIICNDFSILYVYSIGNYRLLNPR